MILLVSPKNKYATQRLLEEAPLHQLGIDRFDVRELAARNFNIDINMYSGLYVRQAYPYYEQIINLAQKFKQQGKVVIDEEEVTGQFDTSKVHMYEVLKDSGQPIPRTELLGHHTFGYPFVLKWEYGFGSKDVFLVHDSEELNRIKLLHPEGEWLAQEYIEATCEYEVYVVGYRAIPTLLSFPTKDGFKADVHHHTVVNDGEERKLYEEIKNIAERAARAMGRELAKVDILESNGRLYILEVNRSPGLVSFQSLMGYNIAGAFINYIKECVIKKGIVMKSIMEKPEITPTPQPLKPQQPPQPQA